MQTKVPVMGCIVYGEKLISPIKSKGNSVQSYGEMVVIPRSPPQMRRGEGNGDENSYTD